MGCLRRPGPDEHRHSSRWRPICRRGSRRGLRPRFNLEHETNSGHVGGEGQVRAEAVDADGPPRRMRQLRKMVQRRKVFGVGRRRQAGELQKLFL